MLIDFSISNFRSINERQTLSMVASNRYQDHPEHLAKIPGSSEKLLPLALIYGANGAGKSNLVRGLAFMHSLVVDGTGKGKAIPRQSFRLGPKGEDKPTECEVRFVAGQESHVFTYGFRVTDTEVEAEWLSVLEGDAEIDLFERETEGGKTRVDPGDALKTNHPKELALATIGARSNQLFLAAIRESIDPGAAGPLMVDALSWIDSVSIVSPYSEYGDLNRRFEEDPQFAKFAGQFLRDIASGINQFRVEQGTVPIENLPDQVREAFTTNNDAGGVLLSDIHLERTPDGKVRARTLHTEHLTADGRTEVFRFRDESDGTQRLTHLLPMLFDHPRVDAIDELERSLHPLLAKKFLEIFVRTQAARKCQLIVTTHESSLLDLDLLRRDEVWFTEKDDGGATSIYSLADFNVRTDLNIEKGYLQGRFEAIPFLGDLDAFLEKLEGRA